MEHIATYFRTQVVFGPADLIIAAGIAGLIFFIWGYVVGWFNGLRRGGK
jgi:hypothetical protein